MIARKWLVFSVGLVGVALVVAIAFFIYWQNDEARFIRAVQDGDANTVGALLSRNSELARVERRHKGGTTPVLYTALSRDHKEIVRLLLSNGADPNSCPRALRYANDTETAELLIKHGAKVNWRDENNSAATALHFFAATDNAKLAELVINHGADINAKNGSGETPLHQAAQEGCLNAAKLLVSKGADINAKSRENKTPFDYAVRPVWNEDAYRLNQERIRKCKEVAAYLLECGSPATIFDSAWLGDMQRISELIENNPSLVNGQANGEQLLFAAIRGGNGKVVEYLLAHGAQLKTRGRFHQTPLQLAAYIGYTDVARVLLEHKADIDERGPWGETALHWAAVRGNADVAAILLERGADANSQTSSHTVDLNVRVDDVDIIEIELRRFRIRRDQEIAKKLGVGLQVVGLPRLAFTKGDTPTHAATYWNHADIVKMLIAKGADINTTNGWGETALHYAVVCRYYDTTRMLLDSGADSKAKTNKDMTPVDIAQKIKDKNLIKLLTDRKYP